MDDFPFELFSKIFSYLSLGDKMRCKRVSKQWRMKIDQLSIRCVTVANNFKPCFYHYKWFDRDRFIDYHNYVLESKFESNFFRSTNLILSNLRELVLSHLKLPSIIRALYVFNSRIEKLMIESIIDVDEGEKLYISSPKIRVLSLIDILIEKIIFILPELKMLEFDSLSEIDLEFHHPSSVEHVEFDLFEGCLQEFTGLKILKFDSLDEDYELKKDFLQNKPYIEEIHFGENELFSELQRQRKEYKLSNLKLFYLGLNVTDATSLKQFDDCHEDLNEARLNLYIEDYSKMADLLPFESEIDFTEIESVYSKLPAGFWTKLMYLDSIRVSKRINDESKFIEFIKRVNVFGTLEAEMNCLSKELLKTFSTLNPYLLQLVLKSETTADQNEDDLKAIIANFAYLTGLDFEFAVSLDFVMYAFESRNYLISFAFHHKSTKYRIDEICTEHGDLPALSDEKEYRLYVDESNLATGSVSDLLDKIKKKKFGFLANFFIAD